MPQYFGYVGKQRRSECLYVDVVFEVVSMEYSGECHAAV